MKLLSVITKRDIAGPGGASERNLEIGQIGFGSYSHLAINEPIEARVQLVGAAAVARC